MNTITSFIKNNLKKLIVAVVVALILILVLRGGSNANLQNVGVIRGDLVQEVAVTGITKAVSSVSLGFQTGGQVAQASHKVGDRVQGGDVLAVLDQGKLAADLAKAKADLSGGQVALSEAQNETSGNVSNAQSTIVGALKDAYSKTNDSIRNNIDQFFNKTGVNNDHIDFSFTSGSYAYTGNIDTSLRLTINSGHANIKSELSDWQNSLASVDSATDLKPYTTQAEKILNDAKQFVDLVSQAANALQTPDSQYVSTVNGFKTTVSEARTSVGSALTNLLTAESVYNNAPKQVGGLSGNYDAVLSAEAKVANFQAAVQSAQAALNQTVMTSPIAGVVTQYDTKVGQTVTAGVPLVSVISDNNLEINANVSEVNIGKLAIGNPVAITFDAFPGQRFDGSVVYIDPGETLVDGVVNYKVTVDFEASTTPVKSGLTANLKVKTATKAAVLKVPQYAVAVKNGKSYVEKVNGKEVTETEVIPGFIGNDGTIEIVSGLSLGDTVQVGGK